MTCSVLQLSEDGKTIRSGAAPGLPEIYVNAVDGAPIGPKNGFLRNRNVSRQAK
jgi:hypothetical protein